MATTIEGATADSDTTPAHAAQKKWARLWEQCEEYMHFERKMMRKKINNETHADLVQRVRESLGADGNSAPKGSAEQDCRR